MRGCAVAAAGAADLRAAFLGRRDLLCGDVKVGVFSTIRFVLVMALLPWGPWTWSGRAQRTHCVSVGGWVGCVATNLCV